MDKDFSSEYEKTNDLIISKKNIEIEGQTYQFQFLDKGIMDEDSVSSENAKKGIILVYDVTNNESFYGFLDGWMIDLNKDKLKNVPKILIGNKSDLGDERKIEKNNGEYFAEQNGIKFFETSAKNNTNVNDAFREIINELFEKKKKDEEELNKQKQPIIKEEKEKEEKEEKNLYKKEQPSIPLKNNTKVLKAIQQKKEIAETEKNEDQLNKNISATDDDFGELLKLNEELKGAQEKENKNKKSSIYLKEKKKDSDGEKSNCCHHCWG